MAGRVVVAGIALGGTKTIVALGDNAGNIIDTYRFPTTAPELLISDICDYLESRSHQLGPIAGLGVGAFGPIIVDPKTASYGRLLSTSKSGWSGFDLSSALQRRLPTPLMLVTDVAAAGIGEARFGNLRNIELGMYLTIGTGIGGALLHNGQPLPALLHPELGHLPLVRQPGDDAPSTCHFHPNCAEGLIAGPAIAARFGAPLDHYSSGGPEYRLVADYIGQLLASLQLAVSPQRIVIGGGVLQAAGLIPMVKTAMTAHLGSYIECNCDDLDYLVAPRLGDNAGVIGALAAGALAADRQQP